MIPIYEKRASGVIEADVDMYDPAGRTHRKSDYFKRDAVRGESRRWRLDNSLNDDFKSAGGDYEPTAADYASEAEKEELSLLQRKFKSQLKFVHNYLDVKNKEVDDDDTDLFSSKNLKWVRNPMLRQFG